MSRSLDDSYGIDMSIEVWKDVPCYEGYYQVSNYGNIKTMDRHIYHPHSKTQHIKERLLNPYEMTKGYLGIRLRKGGVSKMFKMHRLVLLVFVGDNILEVNHKDKNKQNNRVDNLEYTTSRKNKVHGVDKSKTSSKYTGVCWNKNEKKWVSSIVAYGKNHHLGYFKCELPGAIAYEQALKHINNNTFQEWMFERQLSMSQRRTSVRKN